LAIDNAKQRVRQILTDHQPYELDPLIEIELDNFRKMVAERQLDEFYLFETPEKQDYENL
jgi:hypothetical protein